MRNENRNLIYNAHSASIFYRRFSTEMHIERIANLLDVSLLKENKTGEYYLKSRYRIAIKIYRHLYYITEL